MPEETTWVPFSLLESFTTDVFRSIGVPDEAARICADVLISADRRGIDSHGVGRLKTIYYDRIVTQHVQEPVTRLEVVRDLKATAVLDGYHGMGMVIAKRAMEMAIAKAREYGAVSIVDGAQAVAHVPVDVAALDCDFYLFSAHKLYGPTGVGVLYGKTRWLAAMPPYQGGGDMIVSVSFENTVYAEPPHKFEAGTPPIVEVIGLGAALDWVREAGLPALAAHENRLRVRAEAALAALPGVRVIGQAPHKAAVISFVLAGIHPHDAGTIMDSHGVAVRVGHHCAEPVMRFFGVPATIRASFAAYNDDEDVDAFIHSVRATQELFA